MPDEGRKAQFALRIDFSHCKMYSTGDCRCGPPGCIRGAARGLAESRRTNPMNAKDTADTGKTATLTRRQQPADAAAGAIGHHRPRRHRCRPALPRHRLLHLRSGLHLDRQLLVARSPTSTATRACCSIAAIRSSSSPRQSNFIEVCYLLLQRRAADQGRAREVPHHHHAPHHGARADDPVLHRASAATRIRWR